MLRIPLVLLVIASTCFVSPIHAKEGEAFSALSPQRQAALRAMVAPPPPAQRTGPYSTPMYYGMYKGYTYEGSLDRDAESRPYDKSSAGPDYGMWSLDRTRLDWQETMVRDWVELGLNNVHLNIYPVNDSFELSSDYIEWLTGFLALCDKHGLRVGVRLDALGGYKAWEMHPNNPQNQIEPYLAYVTRVTELLKGHALYYVLGDELTLHKPADDLDPQAWTPDFYLNYFKRVSAAIKAVDSHAIVSMFAASSGEWFNVLYLLENGYAQHGDAVALNHYDYKTFPKYYAEAQALAPGLKFLSNGVGYCSSPTEPRYPLADPYSRHPTEASHAAAVARTMFACWDLRLDTAPYYVSLRNWERDGKVYPRWFGFFGIEDYIIEGDTLRVRHYPSWHAFRTVAHTFYNRDDFKQPAFDVRASNEVEMLQAYEHAVPGGSELVLIVWNTKGETDTTIRVNSQRYQHPVSVSLDNYDDWADVSHRVTDEGVAFDLRADATPRIIRLFATDGAP